MKNDYEFYRCRLERRLTGEGEFALLAVTEVVQAICDAGFQKHGTTMWSHPSSPHCLFKYAKTPRDGMYKLRAVRMSDMTTLDILIDTRMYPYFLMIDNNPDWQDLMDEVIGTLQQMINDEAEKYNYQGEIIMHHAHETQYLDLFLSALAYMRDRDQRYQDENYNLTYNNNMENISEDLKLKIIQELTKGNVRIGQINMGVKGTINYHEQSRTEEKIEVTDEQLAKALIAINGKDKAVNSQAAWLGACCFLAWNHGYPRNLGDCCKKIGELPLIKGCLEYECKYESIRKFGSWKFVSMDAREWPQYMPREEEKPMFEKCLSVYLALEKEISNQALL